MTIADNIRAVLDRIEAAALRAGRSSDEITLVAVAKTFPADVVLAAIAAGITDIGENRAQELKEKVAVLGDRARWHFVGHLQTNKVRNVIGRTHLVHSVDRFGVAEAISRRALSLGTEQAILIEVNVGGETSKHGVAPPRAVALAEEVDRLEGVAVKGLMTIPPATTDPDGSRVYFKDLSALRDELATRIPAATELSMGMTRDFEVAVEEGATIVRVGEAIFGPRHARTV